MVNWNEIMEYFVQNADWIVSLIIGVGVFGSISVYLGIKRLSEMIDIPRFEIKYRPIGFKISWLTTRRDLSKKERELIEKYGNVKFRGGYEGIFKFASATLDHLELENLGAPLWNTKRYYKLRGNTEPEERRLDVVDETKVFDKGECGSWIPLLLTLDKRLEDKKNNEIIWKITFEDKKGRDYCNCQQFKRIEGGWKEVGGHGKEKSITLFSKKCKKCKGVCLYDNFYKKMLPINSSKLITKH